MLDWLTPTCSATSATDRPRLIRASRRWRARVGLRDKEVILLWRAQEFSDGKANQQVAGHKSITAPQQGHVRGLKISPRFLTHAEYGALAANEIITQSQFAACRLPAPNGRRMRAPLAVSGQAGDPGSSRTRPFPNPKTPGGDRITASKAARDTKFRDQSGGADRSGSRDRSICGRGPLPACRPPWSR